MFHCGTFSIFNFTHRAACASDVRDEIAHADAEGARDFQERREGDFHVPSLDFADEVVMKIGFLREFLLRQHRAMPIAANGLA